MQKLNQVYIKSVVRKALEEDLRPRGDITTSLINSKNKIIKAKIIAKQDGIIAGLEFCKVAFESIGRETVFLKKVLLFEHAPYEADQSYLQIYQFFFHLFFSSLLY